MNEWIDSLKNLLDREYGKRPMIATLATVDETGAPHARSVVCRAVNEASLLFVSDKRSDKNRQLRHNPIAEVVFWFDSSRAQFRLAGEVTISSDYALWRSLSDSSRALFHWPAAGEPRNPADTFPLAIAADAPMPESFEVLTLRPVRVERLDLTTHPHSRRLWTVTGPAGAWSGIDINP